MPAPNTEADFWRQVEKSDGCWLWKGATPNGRYGRFGFGGRKMSAHRFSWELHNGPVPDGKHVLHRCDVTLCVRLDHLFLGDHQANMDDMKRKGRDNRSHPGTAQAAAKIDDDRVRRIREAHSAGARQVDIAAEHGIAQTTVSRIIRRKAWAHVT